MSFQSQHSVPAPSMRPVSISDLNLIDDHLFSAFLANEQYGSDFAGILLRTICGREPNKFQIIPQKYYPRSTPQRKAIQIDVLIEEDPDDSPEGTATSAAGSSVGTLYDIEAEKKSRQKKADPLPKRMRYYHSKIDMNDLSSGKHYDQLRNVFVIVISNFDPFGRGRFLYTIKNSCAEEPDLVYNDGAVTLFLNTRGTAGDANRKLQELLSFIEHSDEQHAVNEDLKRLQSELASLKGDDSFTGGIMHSYERDEMLREEGREEVREEARALTRKESERADAAEKRVAELQAQLDALKSKL